MAAWTFMLIFSPSLHPLPLKMTAKKREAINPENRKKGIGVISGWESSTNFYKIEQGWRSEWYLFCRAEEATTQPALSCSTTNESALSEEPPSPFSLETLWTENPCLVRHSLECPYTSPPANPAAFPETIAYSWTCLCQLYFCNYVIQFNIKKPIKYDCERGVVLWN